MHLLYGAASVSLLALGPPPTGEVSAPSTLTAPAPAGTEALAGAAAHDAPADSGRVRRVPIDGWTDVDARCRVITTFASSSTGCAMGLRTGDVAYFHLSGGFFQTPSYERYMRTVGKTALPQQSVTIIDSTRSNVYYLDLGPGVAIWPTRQLQVHFEAGGMLGVIHNEASLALPTRSETLFTLSAFGGVGASYRVPSMPWAIGFDYRIQAIPYGGLGSGEEVTRDGYEVGHSLFGVGHSFGLSAIFRIEHDGSN